MEEDIKLLEENINNGIIYCGCGYTTEKAIEHLILAYKKLEEENKEWQKAYQEEKDAQFNILINSIPKTRN